MNNDEETAMDNQQHQTKPSTENKLTEEQWRAYCAQWKASKEPQKQFCERRQLNYNMFVYWRSQILKEQGLSRSNNFIPVKVPTTKQAVNTTHPAIELQLPNGILLKVNNQTDASALKMVLNVLGAIA